MTTLNHTLKKITAPEAKKRILFRGFSVLFIAVAAYIVPATAQAATINATATPREIGVGDRIAFRVCAVIPAGATLLPPEPSNGFGSLIVKEWNQRKVPHDKTDSIIFDYALTTYKPENCFIPSLQFLLQNGAAIDTLHTDSIAVTLIPLCKTDSAEVMDLRPQQVTGKRPLLWLWLLLGAALLGGGFFAGRYFLQKLRKPPPPPPPPPQPPYEEALAALAALDARNYPAQGMVREYVFELSDIFKRYIERTFAVNAAEFTTEEMIDWVAVSPLDRQLRGSLEWFFRTADPVKFAKVIPDLDTLRRFGAEVRSFLEATKPAPGTERKTGGAPAADASTVPGTQQPAGGAR
jgi:hypothetical protein